MKMRKIGAVNFCLRMLPIIPLIFLFGACFSSVARASEIKMVGVTEPSHDVKVSFPIDGIIVREFVHEGDFVKQGEPLAQLNDDLQSLEVNRRKLIWRDRSKLKAEKQKLKIISELLQSTKQLYHETGSISDDEVKKMEIQHANVAGEVDALKQLMKKDHIEYEIAKTVLGKHVLTSPIDGIVTETFLEEGEWVRAGATVVRIVNNTVGYLEINMEKKSVNQISIGDIFDVNTEGTVLNTRGKVVFISPVADKASSLVRVKIEFTNNGKLILGNTAFIVLPQLKENPMLVK